MRQDNENIQPFADPPHAERHRGGAVLFILASLLFTLPLWREFHEQVKDPLPFSGYLSWDSTRLVLTRAAPAIGSESFPASIAPLLFEKIPVNSASAELLQSIPGIGTELSRRIISVRESLGRFRMANDLTRVHGIGLKRKQYLSEHLCFD
jgi:competence ComEA-like helix-hairpin-helix protein